MFFIAYERTVNVFAGRVRIVSLSSCRTRAILKHFCPLTLYMYIQISWYLMKPSDQDPHFFLCTLTEKSCLILYSILTPFDTFENIVEKGAFALLLEQSKCSILHNIFKSFQNLTRYFLNIFQCCLKIENDIMI